MSKVLIIGAGHAGGTVATLLRQYGFIGPVVLAGAEPAPPYQRPPLSKAWLKGETDLDGLLLRPESFYAENDIDLRLGAVATGIDRDARTVTFADGVVETYDILILATGSTARRLPIPGADHPDILELRTLEHAEKLKAAIGPGKKLVIVGGGYVGLEAAASARALGAEAVVIEREPRLLARVASEALSRFMDAAHRRHGVDILTGAEVTAIEMDGPDGRGVRLGDGRFISGDTVLVGVGGLACEALAVTSGLACDGGVVVDHQARTSDPAVFAIGDVTNRTLNYSESRRHRLESVPNALEQAKQAASAIAGRPDPAAEVPWFWSDQYDLKLQFAGLPFGADRQIVRGGPDSAPMAVFHLKGDQVVCVEAVNAPAEFMGGRMLIQKRQAVDLDRLADPTVSIKTVAV